MTRAARTTARPTPRGGREWVVVLPVKGGAGAKSRLGAGPDVALAIALDTLAATLACPPVVRVLAVTADQRCARRCAELGAEVVGETAPGAGLNPAVRDGLAAVGALPRGTGLAVLLADLPALRPVDLAEALDAVARAIPPGGAAFVPDAEGTGSVLLASPDAGHLAPAFGPGSAAAHAAAGALRLDLPWARLRRDVDTPAELERALALGVGAHTRAVLAAGSRPLRGSRVRDVFTTSGVADGSRPHPSLG